MSGQIIKNGEIIKLIKSCGTVHKYRWMKVLTYDFILDF